MTFPSGSRAGRKSRSRTASPASEVREMARLSGAGRREQSADQARSVTERHPTRVSGWRALSRALRERGEWSQAAAALLRVTQLAPADAEAHHDLGYLLYTLGREQEAEASYRRALELEPRLAKAYNNLGALQADLGRLAEAAENFRLALEITPDSGFAHYCVGSILERVGGRDEQALAFLERAIILDPQEVNAYCTLGNLLLRQGQAAQSAALFRQARDLRPLITWRARKERADFSLLLLYAPGSGCTPVNYLVRNAAFDCHFYCVLPDGVQHLELLREKADLVINTIADADYGREILPYAQDLVQRLGRPTLNPPDRVMASDRETVARRLDGIPRCRIPKTRRLSGRQLLQAGKNESLAGFALPLLVRLAGNHGGDDFEKFSQPSAISDFVSRHPEADYYLTEYLDYRSADGYFRKYRLMYLDGALYPYHLAIHDDWKVHHFRTDMANQEWMRREEESFLKAPQLVFHAEQLAALRAVAGATGLDYCGIDCALDSQGRVVVFEANAAMLVHDEKDRLFAYKNPYIARIKEAFAAKLARMATVAAVLPTGFLPGAAAPPGG